MDPIAACPSTGRASRRRILRGLAAVMAAGLLRPARASPAIAVIEPTRTIGVDSETASLRYQYNAADGSFRLAGLSAYGLSWSAQTYPGAGALCLSDVVPEQDDGFTVSGVSDLELIKSSANAIVMAHGASGLQVDLRLEAHPGSAFVQQVRLKNGGTRGRVRIGSAATLALDLTEGTELVALAADDEPDGWQLRRLPLPAAFGSDELRNADRSVYPYVRLEREDGRGWLIAVSTATAWRVTAEFTGAHRLLKAGEFATNIWLEPGESARLPDVVLLAYSDGDSGVVANLRRYLAATSIQVPAGWAGTPPVVFNTWFGYGCAVGDDGTDDSLLRSVARRAAEAGAEVFVVDAGWYLGNPEVGLPAAGRQARRVEESDEIEAETTGVDQFGTGLGTWLESPVKWRAEAGAGGSPSAGLRSFSDYVHSLASADGAAAGQPLRFGLWFELDRFDTNFLGPERVPGSWAIAGAPILDLSRPDVVAGISERLSAAITNYRVDYVKLDANLGVGSEPALGRDGHFWTRWSHGLETVYANLRAAHPGLFIEHCASGLKRCWIGLGQVAHSSWLDDDVGVSTVDKLLEATDFLLLPRQKTVLVTEDLGRYVEDEIGDDGVETGRSVDDEIDAVIAAYWGGDRHNGGTIGFSNRIETWSNEQLSAAASAIARWKRAGRR